MATKKKGQEAESKKEKEENAKVGPESKGKPASPGAPDKVKSEKGGKTGEKPQSKEPPKAKKEPPKAQKKDKDDEYGDVGESIKDVRQFLKEVGIEFRKITWPGRQQVIQETWSVLFLVTIITVMVLAFDWVLGHAIFGPIEHWSRMHGGGIGRG